MTALAIPLKIKGDPFLCDGNGCRCGAAAVRRSPLQPCSESDFTWPVVAGVTQPLGRLSNRAAVVGLLR